MSALERTRGMTTFRWMTEVEPELVAVDAIRPTQHGVSFDGLRGAAARFAPWGGDPFPHGVADETGTVWLEDGHHRLALAIARGDLVMYVRVLR